jgi:predicted ArsR family transcriptional regulator
VTVRNGTSTSGSLAVGVADSADSSRRRTVTGADGRARSATARTRASSSWSWPSGASGYGRPRLPRRSVLGPDVCVPPRTPAGRAAATTREDVQVALWRRDQIFEWLYAEGPKTIAEIKDHFDLTPNVSKADVAQLRVEGRLERTGTERQGPRGGRPSTEYRAVLREGPAEEPPVPDELLGAAGEIVDRDGEEKSIGERIAERYDLDLTIDPTPYGDRPGASERTRRISEEVRLELEGSAPEDEPVIAPITVHEQLVVRYITALIGWIERSSIVRDQGPPEHVYDRIERVLQIQDGAA